MLQALQLTVDSFGKWIFLVAYGKKSLEEIFNKIWPMARNQSSDHRNLDGIYTEFRRNLYGNKIFN